MGELAAALALFLLSHMLPMRPRFRQPLEARLGRIGFLLAYSLLSLAIIYWLAHAFRAAPYIALWPWSLWAAWLPVLLMPLACVLIVAGAEGIAGGETDILLGQHSVDEVEARA